MKHVVLALLSAFVITLPVIAQERVYVNPIESSREKGAAAADQPRVIEVSSRLMKTPEAREALDRFEAAKAAGLLPPAGKTVETYDIGDRRSFNVLIDLVNDSTRKWVKKDFILRATSTGSEAAKVNIWVESGEISNGRVTDSHVAALRESLIERTPEESYNPNQGIIANNNAVFGNPPNIDGDGFVDVLLYDITEGVNDCCTLGFVHPVDLDPPSGGTIGNGKEILYLDTNPGVSGRQIETLMAVAAHEYQHLINLNYDTEEFTFVNEGLSDWAITMNGYPPIHDPDYLEIPAEHSLALFTWRGDDVVAVNVRDYARAMLLTTYIADRFGPEVAGSITRARLPNGPARGITAYQEALKPTGVPFSDVLADFHTTNFTNGITSVEHLNYTTSWFRDVRAVPARNIDGRATSSTPRATVMLQPGGTAYIRWRNVEDFTLTTDVDAPDAVLQLRRPQIQPRLVLERTEGIAESIVSLTPSPDPQTFSGHYDRITLVIPHVKPEIYTAPYNSALDLSVYYKASWGGGQFELEPIVYDNGLVVSQGFFSLNASNDGAVATRFVSPAPGRATLDHVQIAPFYLSQFVDGNGVPYGSPSDPRDLKLKIWASDGFNSPGEELFSLDVVDPRPYSGATITLNFFDVDLSSFADQLSSLPDTIFVGYAEFGNDDNYLVAGVSRYTAENVSFIGDLGENGPRWGPLWEVQFVGGEDGVYPVHQTVLPIRASYLIATEVAVEEEGELPKQIALEQNYPNPFNPSTSIRFMLPRDLDVQLHVYDVLGRRVAVLVDGLRTAGTHEVQVDASEWASGLYFYTLRTADEVLTGKMTLVK